MAIGRQMMEVMASRLERLLSEYDGPGGLAAMVQGETLVWTREEIAIGRAGLAFYESWLRAETEAEGG